MMKSHRVHGTNAVPSTSRIAIPFLLLTLAQAVTEARAQKPAQAPDPGPQMEQDRGGRPDKPTVKGESQVTRDVAAYASDQTIRDESRPSGTGFSTYVGLDLGVAQVVPENTEKESSKFGYHLGVKGIATLFTSDLVLDLGGGFAFNQVQGDRDIEELPGGKRNEVLNTRITTKSAFVEFSPRLRLGDSFQVGPVGMALLGTDSSFALPSGKERNAVLAGLSAYWAGGDDLLWRAGVQGLLDVNLFERNVYLAMASVQVGLPIVRQKTIVRDRRFLSVKENVRTQKVEKTVEKLVVKEVVRFLFEEQIINFEFDKSTLSKRSDYFCSELAKFLVANPGIYETITVEGHTDSRGTQEYNMKLSEDRAASVRIALQKYGVPAQRIRSLGYGFSKPLDPANNEVAWARNRRVEMAFGGVRDPVKLREHINRIKDELRKTSR